MIFAGFMYPTPPIQIRLSWWLGAVVGQMNVAAINTREGFGINYKVMFGRQAKIGQKLMSSILYLVYIQNQYYTKTSIRL
jgi:hypothetical protein